MKRKKPFVCRRRGWMAACVILLSALLNRSEVADSAIVPPPWSDPSKNPCASMPGGWQLLYWPPLKQCFKIFTIGYPCPDTMELSPTAAGGSSAADKRKEAVAAASAECRCPPGTALSAPTQQCHRIFERGPCTAGEYFSPLPAVEMITERRSAYTKTGPAQRVGSCRLPLTCAEGMIFWPKDSKCYAPYTKGPCVKGKLLLLNEDGLGECRCEDAGALREYFYAVEETCHEHYTKGPCSTPGHLFLPGGHCDCQATLPHYHAEQQMCYELNTPGPCARGQVYSLPEDVAEAHREVASMHAQCQCKEGYVPWSDGHCYRLYTRGPCAASEFLLNATTCVRNFCGKSRLYFPAEKSCYRIGAQGPCELNQVVVFDFTARPSVDGISYNGMCGCSGVITNLDQQCSNPLADGANAAALNTCESTPGMVELNGQCYKLYSRGPCGPGQWLQPLLTHNNLPGGNNSAKCVCRPGFTRAEGVSSLKRCNAPNVGLARYLTNQQRQSAADHNSHTFPFFV